MGKMPQQDALRQTSAAIQTSQVQGQRKRSNDFALTANVVDGKVSGSLGKFLKSLNRSGGDIRSSTNNLAMVCKSPSHMFLVAENGDPSKIKFTTQGDFTEHNGKIVMRTNTNMVFMVSKNTGAVATAKNLSSSDLVPADVSYFRISKPELSTAINVYKTIVDKNKLLTNASGTINRSTKTELLVNQDIKAGDSLLMKLGGRNLQHTVQYGGVTNGFAIKSFGAFGAKDSTTPFTAGANLPEDTQLTITVGGSAFNFTFKTNNPQTQNGEFKTLKDISAAINAIATGSLLAKLDDSSGTLYIGAKDADNGIEFRDTTGGTLVNTLGFLNVAPNAQANANPPIRRYNTTEGLESIVKELEGVEVSSSSKTSSKFDFSFGRVNEEAQIYSDSRGWNYTKGVFVTKYGNAASLNGGRIRDITIASTSHGLKVGDMIDLDLNGGAVIGGVVLAGGKYVVTSTSANSFTVSSQNDPAAFNPAVHADALRDLGRAITGNAALASWNDIPDNTSYNILNPAGLANGVRWARSAGSSLALIGNNGADSVYAQAAGTLQINYANPAVGDPARINLNDVVYIDTVLVGGRRIPSGYYRVSAIDGGNAHFTITGIGGVGADANAAVAIQFRKVGANAGGGERLIEASTAINAVAVGATTFRVNMPSATSRYMAGDAITFNDLDPANPLVIGGLNIENGQPLEIAQVGADYIDVKLPSPATADSAVILTNNAAFGADGHLDNTPAMFAKLGLNRQKNKWDAIYDPANSSKLSLSQLLKTDEKDFPAKSKKHMVELKKQIQISETIEAFNESGESVKLRVMFAVIDKAARQVVYEICAEENEKGKYPVNTDNDYGLVGFGSLTFDENGDLLDSDTKPITLAFKDSSTISLDFNLADNGNGIRLTASGSSEDISDIQAKSDGFGASQRSSLEIKSNQIFITYKNGQTHSPFNLALGTVENIDYLTEVDGGVYMASADSGSFQFLNASIAGMPEVISNALEYMSEDEAMTAQMDALTWSMNINQVALTITQKQKLMQDLLQKVERVS